jgi:hypothetical protein
MEVVGGEEVGVGRVGFEAAAWDGEAVPDLFTGATTFDRP